MFAATGTRFYPVTDVYRRLRSKPPVRVCLTVATPSDSAACKVKSWLSHVSGKAHQSSLPPLHSQTTPNSQALESCTSRIRTHPSASWYGHALQGCGAAVQYHAAWPKVPACVKLISRDRSLTNRFKLVPSGAPEFRAKPRSGEGFSI